MLRLSGTPAAAGFRSCPQAIAFLLCAWVAIVWSRRDSEDVAPAALNSEVVVATTPAIDLPIADATTPDIDQRLVAPEGKKVLLLVAGEDKGTFHLYESLASAWKVASSVGGTYWTGIVLLFIVWTGICICVVFQIPRRMKGSAASEVSSDYEPEGLADDTEPFGPTGASPQADFQPLLWACQSDSDADSDDSDVEGSSSFPSPAATLLNQSRSGSSGSAAAKNLGKDCASGSGAAPVETSLESVVRLLAHHHESDLDMETDLDSAELCAKVQYTHKNLFSKAALDEDNYDRWHRLATIRAAASIA